MIQLCILKTVRMYAELRVWNNDTLLPIPSCAQKLLTHLRPVRSSPYNLPIRAVPDHEFTGFQIADINQIVNSRSGRISDTEFRYPNLIV